MQITTVPTRYFTLFFFLSTCLVIPYSSATSILGMSLSQGVSASELLLEAKVIDQHIFRNEKTGLIYTRLTLQPIDILKGKLTKSHLEITFLGGEVDGHGVSVNEMVIPDVGEHGIYFVESLSRNQVNPLTGWSQGHYLIKKREGMASQVTTNDGRSLVVDTSQKSGISSNARFLGGLKPAENVSSSSVLTVESFKDVIRKHL